MAFTGFWWLLLASVGFWWLLVAFVGFWWLLVASGSCCSLLLVFAGFCWLLVTCVDFRRLLLAFVAFCFCGCSLSLLCLCDAGRKKGRREGRKEGREGKERRQQERKEGKKVSTCRWPACKAELPAVASVVSTVLPIQSDTDQATRKKGTLDRMVEISHERSLTRTLVFRL